MQEATVTVDWQAPRGASRLHGSVQIGPGFGFGDWRLAQEKPFYWEALAALRQLRASLVRYQGWHNRPDLTVAAVDTAAGRTWDFSKIDRPLLDFLDANGGRPFILNFSAAPASARSPEALADYFRRFAAWYARGGFEDEAGRLHTSGHRVDLAYWEVLNEPDFAPRMSPAEYTAAYDAIVEAVQQVSPATRFIGLALSSTLDPAFTTYFLDPRNHRAGAPVDYVSYHFYALYRADQRQHERAAAVFEQADQFIDALRYVSAIRDALSPTTGLMATEIGAMNQGARERPSHALRSEAQLSAAMYAYLYARLAGLGVEAAHVSGLVAVQPDQMWQELAMLDWDTGEPNARYWVLKLLIDEFPPGCELFETRSFVPPSYPLPPAVRERMARATPVFGQGFVTEKGTRKLLLVNRSLDQVVVSPGADAASQWRPVDVAMGAGRPPVPRTGPIVLGRLAVAIATLEDGPSTAAA